MCRSPGQQVRRPQQARLPGGHVVGELGVPALEAARGAAGVDVWSGHLNPLEVVPREDGGLCVGVHAWRHPSASRSSSGSRTRPRRHRRAEGCTRSDVRRASGYSGRPGGGQRQPEADHRDTAGGGEPAPAGGGGVEPGAQPAGQQGPDHVGDDADERRRAARARSICAGIRPAAGVTNWGSTAAKIMNAFGLATPTTKPCRTATGHGSVASYGVGVVDVEAAAVPHRLHPEPHEVGRARPA